MKHKRVDAFGNIINCGDIIRCIGNKAFFDAYCPSQLLDCDMVVIDYGIYDSVGAHVIDSISDISWLIPSKSCYVISGSGKTEDIIDIDITEMLEI